MPDEQEPVLDKQAALELCDDDEELFLEIVVAYLEDTSSIPGSFFLPWRQGMPTRSK